MRLIPTAERSRVMHPAVLTQLLILSGVGRKKNDSEVQTNPNCWNRSRFFGKRLFSSYHELAKVWTHPQARLAKALL